MHKSKQSHLRIGFDAKRAFNNNTGLGNYSRFIIRSLLKYDANDQAFLFTPKVEAEWEHLFENEKQVRRILPQTMLGKSFPAAWRSFSLAAELDNYKLDVFHGLSNELPVGIENFKGKKIVTIHDLIFLRYPDYYNNIDRFIYTRKFKLACTYADTVIATSGQTKEDIVSFFKLDPQKVEVIYQNCDNRFDERMSVEKINEAIIQHHLPPNFILCVGTIEQRKNQLTVLKAFHQAGIKDHKLVFIGRKTAYANLLDEYIKSNGLANSIIFIDYVKSEALPAIYQSAKMFVYASEFEGFGIPVVEAFRSKVPVLLANGSSLSEVGGDAALYFEPHKVDQLTDLMKDVISNSNLKLTLIQKATDRLTLFEPELLTKQLMATYTK